MNVHKGSEFLGSWLLGSVVELQFACASAIETVKAHGGDPHTVFIEIADGTEQPNLAQLHKRILTDDSCVYDLVIQ